VRVLTPIKINLRLGEGNPAIPAGTRIVLSDWSAEAIAARLAKCGGAARTSTARAYTRPFSAAEAEANPSATVLSWRGCGLGDQLLWAGMIAAVKAQWPRLRVTHFCSPRVAKVLWEGVALPFTVLPEPIRFSAYRRFDLHIIGEGCVEDNNEPDQKDVWEQQLALAGIGPLWMTPTDLCPLVPVADADTAAAAAWRAANAPDPAPLVLWQLASTTPVRSLDPDATRRALDVLRPALPASAVIAVTGTPDQLAAYGPFPDGIRVVTGLGIRALFALVKTAACLVCPDSVLGHVAGAFRTPAVSLWGSFLPADRVGYYTSHRPIIGHAGCPQQPCRKHEKPWLGPGCPHRGGGHCRCLAEIDPHHIARTVKETLP